MKNTNNPANELTKLEYALIHSNWEPDKEDIEREYRYDKNLNPYNEPQKEKLRSQKEIVRELKYNHFSALLNNIPC